MFAKFFFHRLANESGQAILIVVLVMVVALTVGLSIASRTITNLRNSQDQSNSQKALSAAEAGVEQSIKNNVSIGSSSNPQSLGNNASYTTSVAAVSGTKFLLNGNNPVSKDEGIFLWFDTSPWAHPWPSGGGATNIKIYWGDSSNACSNAALEIAIISGASPATSTVKRYALDPCSSRGNNFQTPTTAANTVSGITLHYSYSISISKGYLAKILPVYSNAYVAVDSGAKTLPSQGSTISSTGTSNTATRTVNVYQGYPEIPTEFFPYSLFSP